MKKLSITIFAFILCSICFAKNMMASDFKIVKKQGAITLFERWITGTKDEPVRELKAEFLVESDIESVIRLLKNQATGIEWNKNASLYKIANTLNRNQWINYIKYNMPAMFDDQECCLLYKMTDSFSSDKDRCLINFESTTCPMFPLNLDVKRITGISGQWKLEAQQNHLLKVTYLISSDRNSKIPRFISDPIVHNNLFNTMENFKNLLEK
jgi:hypothetical protein